MLVNSNVNIKNSVWGYLYFDWLTDWLIEWLIDWFIDTEIIEITLLLFSFPVELVDWLVGMENERIICHYNCWLLGKS